MFTKPAPRPRLLIALTIAGLLAVGCSTINTANGSTGGASTNSPISATTPGSTSPDSATTAVSPTTLLASQARVVQPSVTPAPSAKPVPPKPVTPKPVATVPPVRAVTVPLQTAAPAPKTPTIAPGTGQTTTLIGLVMQVDSSGDFDLTYGNVRLRIVMQPTTAVLNLRGKEVIRPYIQPSNNVQVTGTLVGTTLTAQTVVVQTTKDGV